MDRSQDAKPYSRLGNGLIKFCAFGLAVSSAVKFLHPAKPVAYMQYLGYEHEKLYFIAAIELLTAVLFFVRSTRSVGLLLVSSYFGGAIAAHLANHPFAGGGPFLAFNASHHYLGTLPAMLFLACAWIGVWLGNPESLWSFAERTNSRSREGANRTRVPGLREHAPSLP
jgi:hypothetical protein